MPELQEYLCSYTNAMNVIYLRKYKFVSTLDIYILTGKDYSCTFEIARISAEIY